jgi:DNA replication protein DnaC
MILAFAYAHRLVTEYPAIERGLLFAGPRDVGKTHLAVAILRGLIEKGVSCLFYETGELLKAVQDTFAPGSQTSETRVLNPVISIEGEDYRRRFGG